MGVLEDPQGNVGSMPSPGSKARWRKLMLALVCWLGILTLSHMVLVYSAGQFGYDFVQMPQQARNIIVEKDDVPPFLAWDGTWYARIAADGYSFNPHDRSSVAFFPLYPLLARCLSVLMPVPYALLAVSNAFAFLSSVVLFHYCRDTYRSRRGLGEEETCSKFSSRVVCCMLFAPTSFYLRMAYTESLFLFLVVCAMLGMQRRWPAWVIALVIGMSTATRAVGIALMLPFLLYLWTDSMSIKRFFSRVTVCAPIAVSGLAFFCIYQWLVFGSPVAFARSQSFWSLRSGTLSEQAWSLVTLEPIWGVYLTDSPGFWRRCPPSASPLFNLHFWNPVVFVGTVALAAYGCCCRIITPRESLLCLGLLGIPYLTQAFKVYMAAESRYCFVVFPVFIIIATIIGKGDRTLQQVAMCMSAALLAIFTALFCSWHWFF